jgi:hypothetical protein
LKEKRAAVELAAEELEELDGLAAPDVLEDVLVVLDAPEEVGALVDTPVIVATGMRARSAFVMPSP